MKSKRTKSRMRFLSILAMFVAIAWVLPAHATFPGKNGRISFARFVPATNGYEIFTIRADGTDEQQLTFDPPDRTSLFSDWSPDGSRIAFDSDRFFNGTDDIVNIFTMKADGSDVVQLTSHAGFNGEPEYSPDGMKIAFESDRGAGFLLQGIYVMNASNGSSVQRVTFPSNKELDTEPHFSPDGTRIAFTRLRGCFLRFKDNGRFPRPKGCIAAIHVVKLDGTGLTRITQWGQDTGAVDWFPDGTKIAFNTSSDPHSGSQMDIYVANADGSHPINLTNNPPLSAHCPLVVSFRPKWSPDGSKIVFDQFDCEGGGLWIMNADGSGKQPLASNFEDKSDWGTNQD
jgi:Tol biopolymer transport system component